MLALQSELLTIIETHPVQYHAPVYRAVAREFGIPVTAVYGSDFSIAGYRDPEFEADFAWDVDLLSGYQAVFLARVGERGARTVDRVSARGLSRRLDEIQPRAILLVGYASLFHQLAFLHAWRRRVPILFRAETTDHARQRSLVKTWVRDQTLRWFYKRCARLLYVGRRSHEHYQRLADKHKLVFSPYCVNTEAFRLGEAAHVELRGVTRRNLGISEGRTVLLFSGKLSKRKGPDLLLRAVKELPSAIRDSIVVMFVGSGALTDQLKDMAERSPSVEARFLGFQNQSSLSSCYHAADLLVMPSLRDETWGLVVNEALHHGLPCVVSDAVGCAPDLIEPHVTGEVFEAGSVSGIADAISRAQVLIDCPTVRERCCAKVKAYDVDKSAEGIAHAYRMVTGEGNGESA